MQILKAMFSHMSIKPSPDMTANKRIQWDVLALCVHLTEVAGVKSVCAVEWKEGISGRRQVKWQGDSLQS